MKNIVRGMSVLAALLVLGSCDAEQLLQKKSKPFSGVKDFGAYIELGDYRHAKAELLPAKPTWSEVTREAGRTFILASEAHAVPGEEHQKIEDGDTVTFDFEGTFEGASPEALAGMKAEKTTLVVGSGQFIPGFEDQMIGKNVGTDFDVDVVFPGNYQNAELAGKRVVFACHAYKSTEMTAPKQLDAQTVREVFQEKFASVQEYFEAMEKRLIAENLQKNKRTAFEAALEQASILEIPEADQVRLVNEAKARAEDAGQKLDVWAKEQGEETFEAYEKKVLAAQLKEELFLFAIAKKEKISTENATAEDLYPAVATLIYDGVLGK